MELQLPISDLGHNPGLWGAGHSVITRVLKIARGRQESQSQRRGDVTMEGERESDLKTLHCSVFKIEEEALGQGMQMASRSCKRQEMDTLLEHPEGTQVC